MDILVKVKTKSGANEYKAICNIEGVFVYDHRSNEPKLEITEKLCVRIPVKPISLDKYAEKL